MAGLLLFLLLNTVFIGPIALSPDTDSANRVVALFIFIPLLFASVMFAFGLHRALFAERLAGRRWIRINRELHEMGFRDAMANESDHTLGLPVNLLAPPTLALQRGGGIDHVTVGQVEGHEVRCFNVRIRGSGWMDVPAAALRVEASFAATVIRPFKSPLPPRPDMKRARFEHERFNRSVAVFSVDPFFASAMVDARMMEWLLTEPCRITIELADRWVVAWCLPRRGLEGPRELIDILIRFDERIPRAVPSLFPERHAQLEWKHRIRSR